MAYGIDIKYFNSFWLKKATKNYGASTDVKSSTWPGLPWNPFDKVLANAFPVFPYGTGATPGEFAGTTSTPVINFAQNWFVEESRIRGGYNNVSVDLGARAYLVDPESKQVHRKSSLIYSGIFNSRTGINETNQFSTGVDITRSLDPAQGSIQKLYAEDTNLIIFQENKVNRALIDKDTIYTTESGTATQLMGSVIGQIVPYLGEYGISDNPESFAIFGYRKYFCDRYRGVVLRLSRDGITEISQYGMRDYFRDYLRTVPNDWTLGLLSFPVDSIVDSDEVDITSATCPNIPIGSQAYTFNNGNLGPIVGNVGAVGDNYSPAYVSSITDQGSGVWRIKMTPGEMVDSNTDAFWQTAGITTLYFGYEYKSHIVGAWDNHSYNYTLSLQSKPRWLSTESSTYNTLSFDESVLGWTSFYSYKPIFMDSLKNSFYSFIDSNVYQHYDEITQNTRGVFYNVRNDSNVTLVFNPNVSIMKNFQTVSYEGSNGWEVDEFKSGFEGTDFVNSLNQEYQDTTATVRSYSEGLYTENGIPNRAGFDRKENRYVANLVNSSAARPGEIIFGAGSSGIKGYFATVKLSTDATTDLGGMKELFSVGSKFVTSSY